MSWRRPSAAWCAVLLAGTDASMLLGLRAEERMIAPPAAGQRIFSQASGPEGWASGPKGWASGPNEGGGPRAYQRISKSASMRVAQYGFQNFNLDRLEVSYQIPEKDFRPYNEAFGYTKEAINEVKAWHETARQSAYRLALKQGKGQAQLDAAIGSIDREYGARLQNYLAASGFRMTAGNVVAVDMPALVRKNSPLVKPLSLNFEKISSTRRYRSPDIIGAALSFVQTAMYYKQPDPVYKEKHTGGVLPPITAILAGWGDCDTKTGLLGSLLSNWAQMRMVGVGVPGHYLMGVLLIPEKGDLFLEHQGLQYVLIEPSGPAWLPPGQVGEATMSLLDGREGYKIEPFF